VRALTVSTRIFHAETKLVLLLVLGGRNSKPEAQREQCFKPSTQSAHFSARIEHL
jgi:hypothetical protein